MWNRLIYILLIASVLVGCKNSAKVSEPKSKYTRKPITEVTESQLKADALAIDAKMQVETGDYENAVALYNDILKKYPDYAVAYYELGSLYYSLGEVGKAIEYSKKADQLSPGNIWYKLQLAELYERTHQTSELIKVRSEMLDLNSTKPEFYYELANAYTAAGRYKEAVAVFNRVEKIIGITEPVSMQKQKLWYAVGDSTKALKEIEALAKANPDEQKYNAILANMNMERRNYPEALKYYTRIAENNPDDEYIHVSLAEYYKKVGNSEKAYDELKKAFQNPKLDIRSKRQILGTFYNSEEFYTSQSKYAFDLAETLIQQDPDSASYSLFYGDILMRQGKYERAANYLRNYLALDSSDAEIWSALVRCDFALDNDSLVLSDAARACNLFPTDPMFYYMQGMSLYRMERKDEAIAVLEKGVKSGFSNMYLEADFYQMLAELHHQQGNNEVSDAYYEKVLKIIPDDISVMNNYAYSLAGRGVNLDKAHKMSRTTIEKEPKNAYYLDTYAWVLYKMGNYKEAERYILLAIKYSEKEDNRTCYEHYVEILKAQGKKNEAETVTNKYLDKK